MNTKIDFFELTRAIVIEAFALYVYGVSDERNRTPEVYERGVQFWLDQLIPGSMRGYQASSI